MRSSISPWIARVSTGVLALLFCGMPTLTGSTGFDWIAVPFWLPGLLAAGVFFQTGIHSDHPQVFLVLACGLNFLLDWAFLLAVWKFVERLTNPRRREEK